MVKKKEEELNAKSPPVVSCANTLQSAFDRRKEEQKRKKGKT